MIAPLTLSAPLLTVCGLLMVAAVVSLVVWALQLMQAATDRREFSLMLAGCMVCSAAVGLATVMVITLTGPDRIAAHGLISNAADSLPDTDLDSLVIPWEPAPAAR